jgi:hypothetical protein
MDGLGRDRLAWWKDGSALQILNENVLVAEKERAQRMAEA